MSKDRSKYLPPMIAFAVVLMAVGFLMGNIAGERDMRERMENEAIQRGLAHIVLRDGRRTFEWIAPEAKP